MKNQKGLFNLLTQVAIPVLTISSQVALALKYPQWGLVINMAAQPFWIYSAWKSYRQAGQIGFLVTVIITTVIISFGLMNYWILS